MSELNEWITASVSSVTMLPGARNVLHWLNRFQKAAPVVLTGDFNAEHVSAERSFPLLRDAWREAHPVRVVLALSRGIF